MQEDRVLVTEHGHFVLRAWDGANGSGITPLSDKVLVLVDEALEATRGGIIITDQAKGTQTLASTSGILVAVGPQAFVWDSDRAAKWEGERPAAGLRVLFQRYAGQEYTGKDGRLYRLIQDRQIGGSMGMAEVETAPAKKKGRGTQMATSRRTLITSAADAPFGA